MNYMKKKDTLIGLGLIILVILMIHFKKEPVTQTKAIILPPIKLSEIDKENDTLSIEKSRPLKLDRSGWLEKYGKNLHPQSNKKLNKTSFNHAS